MCGWMWMWTRLVLCRVQKKRFRQDNPVMPAAYHMTEINVIRFIRQPGQALSGGGFLMRVGGG